MADVFRKNSLDRLSSPEQLDTLITITSTRKWIALFAVGLILVAAILWGIFGKIPVKVDAAGILTSSGGVSGVQSKVNGQVTDINVEVGDSLAKGDIIAIISDNEVVKQINKNKELIDELNGLSSNSNWSDTNVSTDLSDLQQIGMQRQTNSSAVRAAGVDVEYARKDYESAKKMYKKKQITKEQLSSAKAAYSKAQAAYSSQQLAVSQSEGQFDSTKDAKLNDLKEQNKELKDALESDYTIVAPEDGKIASVDVQKGSIVGTGTVIVNMAKQGSDVKDLESVVYAPIAQAKKLTEGMEVKIYPSTHTKEEYGSMMGTVVSVSEFPVNGQAIMETLGNEALAQQLSGQGATIEVKVDLITDPDTESGYAWTSRKGEEVMVQTGTVCMDSIIIEYKRPITMVIPILKEKVLPIE